MFFTVQKKIVTTYNIKCSYFSLISIFMLFYDFEKVLHFILLILIWKIFKYLISRNTLKEI